MNYQQQPYQQVQPAGPRVAPGVLVGVSVWRLLIVISACVGFFSAMSRGKASNLLPALSQQASLLVGIVYLGLLLYPVFTGGRRHEPKSPWWRGSMVILLILVCVTYLAIIGGSLDATWSLFEHLITPLLVLVDYLAVGRNQAAAKWWHPITWLSFPLAYLVYYIAADLRMYGSFLNPKKSAFPGVIAGFIAALLVLGFILFAFGKMKAAAARQRAGYQPYQGYPQQYQQAQYQQPGQYQQDSQQYPQPGQYQQDPQQYHQQAAPYQAQDYQQQAAQYQAQQYQAQPQQYQQQPQDPQQYQQPYPAQTQQPPPGYRPNG
ncbi:hypothetical protein [Actinocrispum wychmicini]|uniref:FAR-17a/AIG1-like protein n=1 Tax=Actinocrispum wychmicini TaxID=1213861 RepID=A0A4R2IZI0_9PSEU|nr:hypothetical protein [Actinocrispum wychmicini]TCO49818.1 hypothetical protein EV192_114188 [Actinocrispum wychmicini]